MTIVRYQIHCLVSKNVPVIIVIEDDCDATMFQCRSAQEKFAHVHHVNWIKIRLPLFVITCPKTTFCQCSNLGPLPRRSPQHLWIHLNSSVVALVCCHCEAAHPWETRKSSKSSISLRRPKGKRGRAPKRCTEPMNRGNSKQHSIPKPPSKHQGS